MLKKQPLQRLNAVDHLIELITKYLDRNPHVTKTDFARKAGVSRSYFYEILSGAKTPTLDVAERLAQGAGQDLRFARKKA